MNKLMVVWQGESKEEFGVFADKNITVGSDAKNVIVISAGEGVPESHELLRYDLNSRRWKLRVPPLLARAGYLRFRGGGKKVRLGTIAHAGHLKQDAGSRIFTLYTHQLTGLLKIGSTRIHFYFAIPTGRVARPPQHLT